MADSPRTRPPIRGERVLRRQRLVAASVAVLLAVVGVGVLIALAGDDGAAPAKVRLAGVDVSGRGPDEVRRATRARAEELMAIPLLITRRDDRSFRLEVTRASLEARPQIRRAVAAALEPRSLGGRLVSLLGLSPTREIPLAFTLNPRKVSALIDRVRRPRAHQISELLINDVLTGELLERFADDQAYAAQLAMAVSIGLS